MSKQTLWQCDRRDCEEETLTPGRRPEELPPLWWRLQWEHTDEGGHSNGTEDTFCSRRCVSLFFADDRRDDDDTPRGFELHAGVDIESRGVGYLTRDETDVMVAAMEHHAEVARSFLKEDEDASLLDCAHWDMEIIESILSKLGVPS